jgi:hypothetical protein
MDLLLQFQKTGVPIKRKRLAIDVYFGICFCMANSLVGTTDVANWLLENTLSFIFVFLLIANL